MGGIAGQIQQIVGQVPQQPQMREPQRPQGQPGQFPQKPMFPGMGYPAQQPGTRPVYAPFQGTAGPGAPPPMQVQPGTYNPQLEAMKQMFQGQQQPPFDGGLNKPFVNAPYQPATNMMSEADFNVFLQRQNEMQAANPNTTFVNPAGGTVHNTYQDYVNEVNRGQQVVANNIVSAQERARRGIIGQGNDIRDSMPYGTPDSFGNLPNYYGQPQVVPTQIQGLSRGQPSYGPTSQEAYNRFLATAKPARGGSLPSYEQFVQNRNTPRPIIGPMRPQMPQIQQPVDPRRSGLAGLAGLNGVPGNQNPNYFGPGYK
jgi:hypothetical protein